MLLTKFSQSCVLIKTQDKKILVDPGVLSEEKEIEQMSGIDIILITHKHEDHFCEKIYEKIKKQNTVIYSSKEVSENFQNTKFEIVKEKDEIKIGDITIRVVKAVHGYIPYLTKNKIEINENIGFIVEAEGKKIYFTSDTICFKNDYKCDILFLPVCDHGLVMGPFEASLFAKGTGASIVIPCHYDNPKFPADIERVKKEFDKQELNWKFLEKMEKIKI